GAVAVTVLSVNDEWTTQLAVLLVSGHLVFRSANVFKFWFKSEIKSKYPVWIRSGVVVVTSASQVAFILLRLPVTAFLLLYLVQSGLKAGGTFLMYQYISQQGRSNWTFQWTAAQKMMRDAWPLIFASLSVGIYMKIDQVMLGEMVGKSAVGIYATAVKISELWYFIPAAISSSIFPKIVSSKENVCVEVYRKRMQAFYDMTALMSYVIIVPVVVSAGPLIDLLFGTEYESAAPILQVHIWAFLFVSIGTARKKWLVAENFTKFSMLATMLGAVANIGLNALLIREYGGIGAAWATLLSQFITAYLVCMAIPSLRVQLSKALVSPFRPLSAFKNVKVIFKKNG
ncbi:MAG: flippase, partial [Cyanobacteria bacterium SW_9_47_5]